MPSSTTEQQLERAFDAVANHADWRGPIDITLAIEALDAAGGWAVVYEAVQHFTATTPRITYGIGCKMARIEALGYRAGAAGP